MLSKNGMIRYYDSLKRLDPRRYSQRFAPGILDHPVLEYFTRLKLDLLQVTSGRRSGRLLDLGCGTGFYLPLLSKNASRVTAVDLSSSMVRIASRFSRNAGLRNVTVRRMDLERLSFPDASFDTVLSMDVLHHVSDIPAVLGEARRVLKPGGLFLAVEVNPLNPAALAHNLILPEERGVLRTFPGAVKKLCEGLFKQVRLDFLQYWPYFPTKTPPSWLGLIRGIELFFRRIPLLMGLSVYYALSCRLPVPDRRERE